MYRDRVRNDKCKEKCQRPRKPWNKDTTSKRPFINIMSSLSNLMREIKIRNREHFGFGWIEIYMDVVDTREKNTLGKHFTFLKCVF